MTTVPEIFGSMVFDSRVMKARLSGDVYHSLKRTIQKGTRLDLSVAMRSLTHEGLGSREWSDTFHTLVPASDGDHRGKHDSFITPAPDGRCSWNSPARN